MSGLDKRLKQIKKATPLIVTPKIDRFLMDHPDGVIWDDEGFALFREIVERSKGNDASARAGRFGASSRGRCLRQQCFTFIGMPSTRLIDPDAQNLFNDGHWRHLKWQMTLVQSGAATHAEWPAAKPSLRVKVSIDALHADQQYLVELKGDRNMARLLEQGIPEDHNLQMHTMMLVTGWDQFVYIMEDKASSVWRELIVRKDVTIMDRVRAELETLNDHVERHVLPDILPACAAKEGPYKRCAYAVGCLRWHQQHRNDWPLSPSWE